MKKQLPNVVGIVLNWNGLEITYDKKPILETCIKTLTNTDYKNLKIIVADAESSDKSIEYLHKNFPFITTIKVKNLGWAYGNNKAIIYSLKHFKNAKYILLLNNDLIFQEKRWLKKMIKESEKDKHVGITGCRLLYPDGSVQHAGTYLRFFGLPDNYKKNRKTGYVFSVIGACMLIKKEVLEKIGLFDETYLPFLEEEVDFCERAKRAGYKVLYVGNTKVIHLEGKTLYKSEQINQKWTEKYKEFIFVRNNFIFLLRWHKWHLPANLVFRLFTPLLPRFILKHLHRTPIKYHFSNVFPALLEALRCYKIYKIPKVNL